MAAVQLQIILHNSIYLFNSLHFKLQLKPDDSEAEGANCGLLAIHNNINNV